MGGAAEPEFDEGELEALVLECLEAPDPHLELERRAAGRPALMAAAERLIAQVSRLEQLDASSLVGAPEPRGDDPRSWPRIPGVELQELIGRGGQGLVFKGAQRYLARTVAVKLLAPELQTRAFVERFRREARMLAALKHPHIVTCHDAGTTDAGQCYLVMEFVDGPHLWRWLEDHGRLDVATALQLIADLVSALEHAQRDGLVHRDVKPENVLLQPRTSSDPGARAVFNYVPKLVDFGLARPIRRDAGHSMLTPVGSVVGTPATMSPEQFDAPDSVDHRADIYGLGCVLFHALAGRPMFSGGGLTEVLLQKIALRDAGGRVALEGVPAGVSALVSQMLAWDLAARPQSYAELRAALEALLPRGGPARQGPRKLPLWSAAVCVLALVVGWRLLARAPRAEEFASGRAAQAPDASGASSEAEAPLAAPSFGPPKGLFSGDAAAPLAGWVSGTPQHWAVDELGLGVLVNTQRGRSAARRELAAPRFELRGELEPRYRFESTAAPRVPIEALGLRLELPGGDALGLAVAPIGERRFSATWRRERRDGAAWRTVEDLGSCEGEFPDSEPLAFVITWTDGRFDARCGPRGAPHAASTSARPATEWGDSRSPVSFEIYAERGVAVLTGWTLAVAE